MIDTTSARSRLERQLAELEARQAHLASDLAEPLDPDSSERAIEVEDEASLEAQANLVANEIASTRRALDRIADGSYGECVRCGAEIGAGRLEARPEAALCIGCASRDA